MQDGDPVVEQTTEVKEPQEEIVLSQEENKEPEENKDDPKGKSPEERFKNSQFAQTRIQNKKWRSDLQELRNNPKSLIEEAAKDSGYDISKEENKQQVDFHANLERKKAQKEESLKRDYSNKFLTETFKNMGIDPFSRKAKIVGSALFDKHRFENPDVYLDESLVRREMDEVSEEFVSKKDPVNESIMRKASSNLPQKVNPRGASAPSEDKRLAEEASNLGVSKEKYKIILEKQKKTPSWAKRRS